MLNQKEADLLRRKTPVRTEEAHIDATVKLAQRAYGMRRQTRRIGFFAFCLGQIGFCGWQTWLLQAGLLLCMALSLYALGLPGVQLFAYPAPFALRALAVLAVLTVLPTLYRSNRYRMFETEIATQTGYARLLLSRLLLVTVGDLAMLAGALAFTVLTTDIGVLHALYCVLPPYLLMLSVLLTLLPRVPMRTLPSVLLALGAVMLLAAAAHNAAPPPSRESLPLLCLLCALMLALSAAQLVKLRRQGCFADVQFLS